MLLLVYKAASTLEGLCWVNNVKPRPAYVAQRLNELGLHEVFSFFFTPFFPSNGIFLKVNCSTSAKRFNN